jgi:hypothetical protein
MLEAGKAGGVEMGVSRWGRRDGGVVDEHTANSNVQNMPSAQDAKELGGQAALLQKPTSGGAEGKDAGLVANFVRQTEQAMLPLCHHDD